MFKSSVRKILVTVNAVYLILLFSITSFSDGYSFQEDGDALNQNFSGTNYVYTNGVYVGEMGAIDAYMDNYGNTYNGTNIIDATAYPGVGQDDESTYNGTLAVTANDILSSKTIVDDATVNAATTVTVNEVLSDNNLNAGVQFNNSEFNSDVTLSGSGAVNLAGSTVNNLVLGNIPQMASLIKAVAIIMDNISYPYVSTSSTRTFTFDGTSYSYSCPFRFTTYYMNFYGYLKFALMNFLNNLTKVYTSPTNSSSQSFQNITWADIPIQYDKYTFTNYSYDSSTDVISTSNSYYYCSFLGAIWTLLNQTYISYINANIAYMADTWYRWYSPNISASDSQFWIAFNTDTEVYDHVNLSTVFGYITWYLGQLYIQGNEAASDITQSVSDLSDTLTDFETKEGQINNSIKSSLNNVDSFFQLPAITAAGTVIGWLQYMWVSLGTFQAVTIIAWALVILTIVTGFYKIKRITV